MRSRRIQKSRKPKRIRKIRSSKRLSKTRRRLSRKMRGGSAQKKKTFLKKATGFFKKISGTIKCAVSQEAADAKKGKQRAIALGQHSKKSPLMIAESTDPDQGALALKKRLEIQKLVRELSKDVTISVTGAEALVIAESIIAKRCNGDDTVKLFPAITLEDDDNPRQNELTPLQFIKGICEIITHFLNDSEKGGTHKGHFRVPQKAALVNRIKKQFNEYKWNTHIRNFLSCKDSVQEVDPDFEINSKMDLSWGGERGSVVYCILKIIQDARTNFFELPQNPTDYVNLLHTAILKAFCMDLRIPIIHKNIIESIWDEYKDEQLDFMNRIKYEVLETFVVKTDSTVPITRQESNEPATILSDDEQYHINLISNCFYKTEDNWSGTNSTIAFLEICKLMTEIVKKYDDTSMDWFNCGVCATNWLFDRGLGAKYMQNGVIKKIQTIFSFIYKYYKYIFDKDISLLLEEQEPEPEPEPEVDEDSDDEEPEPEHGQGANASSRPTRPPRPKLLPNEALNHIKLTGDSLLPDPTRQSAGSDDSEEALLPPE